MKIRVDGQACLDYINKPIGFVNKERDGRTVNQYVLDAVACTNKPYVDLYDNLFNWYAPLLHRGKGDLLNTIIYQFSDSVSINKFDHDITKRKIGYVTKKYADGGLRVILLGNERFYHGDFEKYQHTIFVTGSVDYETHIDHPTYTKKPGFLYYPAYDESAGTNQNADANSSFCLMYLGAWNSVPFDETLDYKVEIPMSVDGMPTNQFYYQQPRVYELTDDITTSVVFGDGIESQDPFYFDGDFMDDPLVFLQGDIYGFLYQKNIELASLAPASFEEGINFSQWQLQQGSLINETNLVATPYNLLLTENLEFARAYLENGTLPPDAYLFPLDWENLPSIDFIPTGDEPDDYPDDNDPDDDERDFDPTPNETPTYTVNQLTNYNWYWLTVPQWAEFINWFWNDIGDFSDFDDIIAKVKGLYNDVASAVIMCRYYPVDISWIGGLGTQSNIKLGMIEKAGSYDTISQANALRSVDIGHVHIGQKYKSFMDMSPYSQLSLYLPWHGFIDLDMNLFNGHDVYVKALYDYLSGTIQYYIFYDNEVLVNTILCKMAMDIPITLQTKNDRDSAIFNNVSSTIGGLVGAGAGILSGNPIGMTLGITQGVGAFNSANASAPMRLMGNVGESGAYIGCQNCFVVVRRPTIQPSDGNAQTSTKGLTTWKRNVGMLCGYGYKLSSLSGKGFTTCHSPRIDFTSSAPLQSEVDEIYDYLEKGVIL